MTLQSLPYSLLESFSSCFPLGGYTNATEASDNFMVEVDNPGASVVTCQTFGGK